MIPTVSMLVYIVVSSLFSRQILAREGLGSACSISNNHLEADTKEFITDCDSFGCKYLESSFVANLWEVLALTD